jgi:alkylhydroperoxidase family enzyme
MAKGGPSNNTENVKINLAKSFALLVAENHLEVDDEIIGVLKEEFSDAEISKLCSFICFIIASQKFGSVLGLVDTTAALEVE